LLCSLLQDIGVLEEGTTITPAVAGTGEEEEEEEEEEENMNHSMNNSMNNSLLDNSMNNSLLDHSSMSDGTLQFEGEKTPCNHYQPPGKPSTLHRCCSCVYDKMFYLFQSNSLFLTFYC
jgi:hypothetical protein